jgi:hypothetical protein
MIDEILAEGITETIVTTLSPEGIPNAAPMGVVRRGDSLFIRMYPDTRTYRNAVATGQLVVNITTDPLVFVVAAFEDLNCSFLEPRAGMPPLIKDAWAWVLCTAEAEGTVRLTPVKSEVARRTVPRYSRGFASVIDAAITGTRLRFLGDRGKERIREDEALVQKCGTPRDIEAMERLKAILGL